MNTTGDTICHHTQTYIRHQVQDISFTAGALYPHHVANARKAVIMIHTSGVQDTVGRHPCGTWPNTVEVIMAIERVLAQ
jgi:hypothetical protein